jgi:hypothetical protein
LEGKYFMPSLQSRLNNTEEGCSFIEKGLQYFSIPLKISREANTISSSAIYRIVTDRFKVVLQFIKSEPFI